MVININADLSKWTESKIEKVKSIFKSTESIILINDKMKLLLITNEPDEKCIEKLNVFFQSKKFNIQKIKSNNYPLRIEDRITVNINCSSKKLLTTNECNSGYFLNVSRIATKSIEFQKNNFDSGGSSFHIEIKKRLEKNFEYTCNFKKISRNNLVFIKKVDALIETNIQEYEFNVRRLADLMYMSRSQLFRKIKSITKKTPQEYIRSKRLWHAKTLLESGKYSVSEVSFKVGFSSTGHFSRAFRKKFDVFPSHIVY